MKTLIPLLILLGATLAALAQGTVLFDNGSLIGRPEVTDPYVLARDGSLVKNQPVADTLRVQLLYGTSADSLTPHTALARFRPSTTTSAGTWRGLDAADTLNRSLPIGGPGTTIFLQVRAWDATAANLSFDALRATGSFAWGSSAVFSYTQRLSSPPATDDTFMLNFEGFTTGIVPEPSVVGLSLMGAAALFLLRRRKASKRVCFSTR
jgi:hypothetical protein